MTWLPTGPSPLFRISGFTLPARGVGDVATWSSPLQSSRSSRPMAPTKTGTADWRRKNSTVSKINKKSQTTSAPSGGCTPLKSPGRGGPPQSHYPLPRPELWLGHKVTGAMRQRKLGSHTPPCHRRMVITTLFNVMLAALQRRPVLYHTRWLLTVHWRCSSEQ